MSANLDTPSTVQARPSRAVKGIFSESLDGGSCLLVEIQNPEDVTEWQGEVYKRTGTVSAKISAKERVALTLRLLGDDYTRQPWQGKVVSSLVMDFAEKVKDACPDEFPDDLAGLSPAEILRMLQLDGKMTAGILFGDVKVRVSNSVD